MRPHAGGAAGTVLHFKVKPAMERLEIRPLKKFLYPFLSILLVAFLALNYVTFFTNYFKERSIIWEVSNVCASLYLVYSIYRVWKKTKDGKPLLTLGTDGISFPKKGKVVHVPKDQLNSWEVVVEDGYPWLEIRTAAFRERFDLAWIDKSPDQVKEFMQRVF